MLAGIESTRGVLHSFLWNPAAWNASLNVQRSVHNLPCLTQPHPMLQPGFMWNSWLSERTSSLPLRFPSVLQYSLCFIFLNYERHFLFAFLEAAFSCVVDLSFIIFSGRRFVTHGLMIRCRLESFYFPLKGKVLICWKSSYSITWYFQERKRNLIFENYTGTF